MFFPQMSEDFSKAAIRGVILWLTHACPEGEFLVSPQEEKVTLWGGLSDTFGCCGCRKDRMCPKECGFGLLGGSGGDFLGHRAIVGWTGLQLLPDKIILRCTLHPPVRRAKKCPHLKPF